jgi:hypothetical protein
LRSPAIRSFAPRSPIYLRKPFRKQVFGEHLAMALNATRFKQPKKADTAQESSAATALKA